MYMIVSVFTNRRCQRLLHAPPKLDQSHFQGAWSNAKGPSPLDSWQRFSTKRENCRVSLVARLLSHSGPSSIAGSVSLIVLDSIKRMRQRWALTHVRKKTGKASPFSTDTNAATTVVGKFLILWIATP
jgi:hypothetical protein